MSGMMRNCREAMSFVLIVSFTLLHAITGCFFGLGDLEFWPMTYDLDLWTWARYLQAWPICQNSGLYLCLFGQDSETEGWTDRQTDNAKTITPTADAGCKNFRNVWMCVEWGKICDKNPHNMGLSEFSFSRMLLHFTAETPPPPVRSNFNTFPHETVFSHLR